MRIKNKKILVTGGAGFIGSQIVDSLLKEGAEQIVVLDNFCRGRMENLESARKCGKVEILNGDIRKFKLVNELCKDVDYVFHEAAIRITQCAKEPRLSHEVMIDGTYNVFEACVKNNVKKLIFASSASVYGDPSYSPMDEKHPFNNKTSYGVGKIYAENLAKSFRDMFGLNYVGLRYFNVYGPRMDILGAYTEVMIKWLDRIDEGKPPIIYGNGKQSMDFVFAEDVVRANMLALKSNVNEGVYNVGTGIETDLNSLCNSMLKITGSKLKPEYKTHEKSLIVSKRQAATENAEKELRFKAETKLEEGIKKLIEWRKEGKNA
jgi:UDP-glucose 4-epimerase